MTKHSTKHLVHHCSIKTIHNPEKQITMASVWNLFLLVALFSLAVTVPAGKYL